MLTAPLNLRAHLRTAAIRPDAIPFIDLGLIALFFVLQSSRLLMAPGLAIDLPTGPSTDVVAPTAIVTITGPNLLLFDGAILRQPELAEALQAHVARQDEEPQVLLLRASASTPLQVLSDISEAARMAGFTRTLLATEEGPG